MKSGQRTRWIYIAAFLLLVCTNGLVIFGVISNRSGQPDTVIALSQRELDTPYTYGVTKNSGLSLHLRWQALPKDNGEFSYYSSYSRTPAWFDENKLKELGFTMDNKEDNYAYTYKRGLPKEVFIVLELGGEPHRQSIRQLELAYERIAETLENMPDDKDLLDEEERVKEALDHAESSASRLFAVDAGLDPITLREIYPDRSRYMVTRAIVEKHISYTDDNIEKTVGYIRRLSIERIHVPLKFRNVLESIRSTSPPMDDYMVDVAFGRRYEPWIVSIEKSIKN